MSAITDFLFNSSKRIAKLELLEISHPSFSKPYRIVRNKVGGCNATVEGVSHHFDFYPLQIKHSGSQADLNFTITVTLGDLGTLIPSEIARCRAAGTMSTKPTVRYWAFRSDIMASPLIGPISVEITDLARTREGCQFEARPPSTNTNRTGELYLIPRFPGLRGAI